MHEPSLESQKRAWAYMRCAVISARILRLRWLAGWKRTHRSHDLRISFAQGLCRPRQRCHGDVWSAAQQERVWRNCPKPAEVLSHMNIKSASVWIDACICLLASTVCGNPQGCADEHRVTCSNLEDRTCKAGLPVKDDAA